MSKTNSLKQKQMLNLIIIAISAMLLLFVLVGKMLDKQTQTIAADSKSIAANETNKLVQIDLGHIRLELTKHQNSEEAWQGLHNGVLLENAQALGERWQNLFNSLSQKSESAAALTTGETLLFYFATQDNPMVAKLILEESHFKLVFKTTRRKISLPREQLALYLPGVE